MRKLYILLLVILCTLDLSAQWTNSPDKKLVLRDNESAVPYQTNIRAEYDDNKNLIIRWYRGTSYNAESFLALNKEGQKFDLGTYGNRFGGNSQSGKIIFSNSFSSFYRIDNNYCLCVRYYKDSKERFAVSNYGLNYWINPNDDLWSFTTRSKESTDTDQGRYYLLAEKIDSSGTKNIADTLLRNIDPLNSPIVKISQVENTAHIVIYRKKNQLFAQKIDRNGKIQWANAPNVLTLPEAQNPMNTFNDFRFDKIEQNHEGNYLFYYYLGKDLIVERISQQGKVLDEGFGKKIIVADNSSPIKQILTDSLKSANSFYYVIDESADSTKVLLFKYASIENPPINAFLRTYSNTTAKWKEKLLFKIDSVTALPMDDFTDKIMGIEKEHKFVSVVASAKSPKDYYISWANSNNILVQKITTNGKIYWNKPKIMAKYDLLPKGIIGFSSVEAEDGGLIVFLSTTNDTDYEFSKPSLWFYGVASSLSAYRINENGNLVEVDFVNDNYTVCQGEELQIDLKKYGNFEEDNKFKVAIVDDKGRIITEKITSDKDLKISLPIKSDLNAGEYQMKVGSSSPASESAWHPIKINIQPRASIIAPPTVYKRDSTKIKIDLIGNPPFSFTLWNGQTIQTNQTEYSAFIFPKQTNSYSISKFRDANCSNGISNTINITLLEPLATEQSELAKIEIFPNPTQKRLVINYYSEQNQDYQLEIYDSKGTPIDQIRGKTTETGLNQIEYQLKENNLAGLYFLKLRVNNKIFVKKIVKESR